MIRYVLLFLLLPVNVYAACQTANVYTDIDCYQSKYKKDKALLNAAYNRLYENFDDTGKQKLEASQKAWLLYRAAQCDGLMSYIGSQAMGAGSGLINISCLSELTEARLTELKALE